MKTNLLKIRKISVLLLALTACNSVPVIASVTTTEDSSTFIIKHETAADLFSRGVQFAETGDFKNAAHLLKDAAKKGHAEAQLSLAIMYYEGAGLSKDFKVAAKWYEQAANQGSVVAQFLFGAMYYKGEGVTKDYKAAAKWFEKAANQKNAKAQFALGRMHAKGEGVPTDYFQCFFWSSLAAAAGEKLELRDLCASKLTPEQLILAQKKVSSFRSAAHTNSKYEKYFTFSAAYLTSSSIDKELRDAIKTDLKDAAKQLLLNTYRNSGKDYAEVIGTNRANASVLLSCMGAATVVYNYQRAMTPELVEQDPHTASILRKSMRTITDNLSNLGPACVETYQATQKRIINFELQDSGIY